MIILSPRLPLARRDIFPRRDFQSSQLGQLVDGLQAVYGSLSEISGCGTGNGAAYKSFSIGVGLQINVK